VARGGGDTAMAKPDSEVSSPVPVGGACGLP